MSNCVRLKPSNFMRQQRHCFAYGAPKKGEEDQAIVKGSVLYKVKNESQVDMPRGKKSNTLNFIVLDTQTPAKSYLIPFDPFLTTESFQTGWRLSGFPVVFLLVLQKVCLFSWMVKRSNETSALGSSFRFKSLKHQVILCAAAVLLVRPLKIQALLVDGKISGLVCTRFVSQCRGVTKLDAVSCMA